LDKDYGYREELTKQQKKPEKRVVLLRLKTADN
jgi:hypothetical protein